MKKLLLFSLFVSFFPRAGAQVNVTFNVNTAQGRHDISPYIYGINNGVYKKATWRRWGGNRTSAYNWENNYSNAGADYFHNNDDYIPWVMNLPSSQYLVPASPLKAFHDSSLVQGAMSAITLPMVGYVSRDGAGQVQLSELAPSSRWRQVVNVKGSAFSLTPDTSDAFVYVDEEMNALINEFGAANTPTGIKAYIMDNEPGLWCHQFSRMRDENNDCVTYNELLTKSVSLATTIKNMDSTALVFGPESYGFNEYWSLQNASDASSYSTDHWFVDSYLKHMQQASATAGKRLLDVFSVHWYPDVNTPGVFAGDTAQAVGIERMACTRTLWDSSYTSDSWIGQWFGAELPIMPRLKASIDQFYPGTKFCIDEYSYGAANHISGGIAQVEALGAFGKTNVDYAAIWTEVDDFVRSAFDLYRDYDGNDGTFGDISVSANSNDLTTANLYAAVEDSTNKVLHIIVTNKSYTDVVNGTFNLQSNANYNKVAGYYFNRYSTSILDTTLPSGSIANNTFSYSLPPLTAHHFVISDTNVLAVNNLNKENVLQLSLAPNPARDIVRINYSSNSGENNSITVTDAVGKTVAAYPKLRKSGSMELSSLQAGIYFVRYTDGTNTRTEKLIITK